MSRRHGSNQLKQSVDGLEGEVLHRPPRIAIAELKQESNSFVPTQTTLDQFRDFHLWYGADLIAGLRDTNTEVGGFLDRAAEQGWEVVPLLAAFAISGGPLTTECFTTLRNDLLARLAAAMPLDGVLLALHGAMLADEHDDPDGAILEQVRALVGPKVPIAVSLDLHANLTPRMVAAVDAIVGFRTCPHIDQRETGQRAANLLMRLLNGEPLAMHMVKLPMITPASLHIHDQEGPYKRLLDAARALEQGSVLATSIFTVQPWLDIPELGYATLVVAEQAAVAVQSTEELARMAWSERHALAAAELVPPTEAIQRALAQPHGPIVLSDLADGTGAGSPGDATAVLAALLEAKPDRPALIWIYDPEVAAAAAAIGVGGTIDTLIGAKRDTIYNQPVRFVGKVELARSASYTFGGQGYTGIQMDMGLSVVLRHGQIQLLVTSKSVMTVDPALFRAVGLEPGKAQIVVVKSHIQFRAGYSGLARGIIMLDSPGMSSDHLVALGFRRVDRPLFPLDPDVVWSV